MHPDVKDYLDRQDSWREELTELRRIVLECGLSEEFKWRSPCYTLDGSNVVILASLKACCSIGFFKGALLTDPDKILDKPGDNSRFSRVVRCTSVDQIREIESALKACVEEAIAAEREGLSVDTSQAAPPEFPRELHDAFAADPDLEPAFLALTPGRQRAFLLQFNSAKQAKTRVARIEKAKSRILAGKGPNDCTCGLTKRPPGCDGSHKVLGKGER